MVATLAGWLVLAAETGIPTSDWRTQLAVPLGVLFFIGPIFMLLRSNLGTRRAHFVLGTAFFAFMVILSLFWAFGAPGTPQATGPTNLPGTPPNAYQPTWTPFAIDSSVAEDPRFSFVREYPEGFGEVPAEFAEQADTGAADTQAFFASAEGGQNVQDTAVVESVQYREAPNGYPVIAVTFQPVDELGQPDPAQEPVTFFAFFDAGSPIFPALVVLGLAVLGFLLYAFLLDRDEQREKRERAEEAVEEPERVHAGA